MNKESSGKKHAAAPLLLLLQLVPVLAVANPPPGAEVEEFVVAFESEPAGAAVRLDGDLLCKETPCRKRVLSGAHEAVFEKERHAAYSQRFTAAKGATVKGTLAPKFGWVSIETTPSGVGVSIDGSDAGKSPVGWREADAGEAEVAVADPCYLHTAERVPLKVGERRAVKLTATPLLAGLKVNADDEKGNALETQVVVDGAVAGAAGSTLMVPVCAKKVTVQLGRERFEQDLALAEGKVAVVMAMPGLSGGAAGGMVRLPGGTFKMSSRGDLVKVSPFLLDVTEVTVAAYGACVQSGKCAATGLDRSEWGSTDSCTWGKADRANYPINCVDWSQAAAYCAAVGTRLPSEEEWEWAARGAELGTTYPWGNEPPRDQLCWNGGSVRRLSKGLGACAVGSFGRGNSPQGVMDLAGNVWEWTSSAHDAPTRVFRDGRWSDAVSSTRIFRGGRWSDADASNVAASHRGWFEPSFRTPLIGFRCARTP